MFDLFAQKLDDCLTAAFIVADGFAVGVEDIKGVEGITGGGAVNTGVDDIQVELLHGRCNHGEQVVVFQCVNEDLGCPFQVDITALLDQYQWFAHVVVAGNGACVPHHVVCPFAQEVVFTAIFPDGADFFFFEAVVLEPTHGVALGVDYPVLLVDNVFQAASQSALGFRIELAQQGGAPGVPECGVGGVNIRDGQRVEIVKPHLIADFQREIADHVRIGNILALRGGGHQQVLFHQPAHEVGVAVGQAVVLAEYAGIDRSKRGVITAAPFGDVVIQPGHIEQFRFVHAPDDA